MESECGEAAPSLQKTRPLTYEHFPLSIGLGHLVSTTHLIQAHAPEDENNEAGTTAVLPRGLILVPVPIAGAGGRERGKGGRGRGGERERERERLVTGICTYSTYHCTPL